MDFWFGLILFMNSLCTNFQSKHKCKIIENLNMGLVPHTHTHTHKIYYLEDLFMLMFRKKKEQEGMYRIKLDA